MVSAFVCLMPTGVERHCISPYSGAVIAFAFMSLPGFRLKFVLSCSTVLFLITAPFCLLAAPGMYVS